MTNDEMTTKAKKVVMNYFNSNQEEYNKYVTKEDVLIVWFCKTLQNWKALVITTKPDLTYYEVTYNGDKAETYLDVYDKVDKKVIKDKILKQGAC